MIPPNSSNPSLEAYRVRCGSVYVANEEYFIFPTYVLIGCKDYPYFHCHGDRKDFLMMMLNDNKIRNVIFINRQDTSIWYVLKEEGVVVSEYSCQICLTIDEDLYEITIRNNINCFSRLDRCIKIHTLGI